MNVFVPDRDTAKQKLRDTLAQCKGDTKHEQVIEAIETLTSVNPTDNPARNIALRDGHWLLISAPSFPGAQVVKGETVYTLGRLAFNQFQPTELKLKIDRVSQPVLPIGKGDQRTHDIIVEFSTVEDRYPSLNGIVKNLGVCEPLSDDVIQVMFTGGTLCPQAQCDLQTWHQVFGDQSKKHPTSLREKGTNLLLKLVFGLQKIARMNPDTGELRFEMKRSPKGKLQILYLDEDLRITKGERGTVLICERQI